MGESEAGEELFRVVKVMTPRRHDGVDVSLSQELDEFTVLFVEFAHAPITRSKPGDEQTHVGREHREHAAKTIGASCIHDRGVKAGVHIGRLFPLIPNCAEALEGFLHSVERLPSVHDEVESFPLNQPPDAIEVANILSGELANSGAVARLPLEQSLGDEVLDSTADGWSRNPEFFGEHRVFDDRARLKVPAKNHGAKV